MSSQGAQPNTTAGSHSMAGAVNRKVLIALLAVACAAMAYRLITPTDDGAGAKPSGAAVKSGGGAPGSQAQSAAGKSGGDGMIDPTLRLDLLSNSRAITYSGSKRNIFLISGGAAAAVPGTAGTGPKAGGPPPSGTQKPPDTTPVQQPPPPVAPPVVIPLKFYGIAERAGGSSTKALLTSGDNILIAQVGQTVAQYFRVVKIGTTKLDLEDLRDHSSHSIPLEDDNRGGGAAPAGGVPPKED